MTIQSILFGLICFTALFKQPYFLGSRLLGFILLVIAFIILWVSYNAHGVVNQIKLRSISEPNVEAKLVTEGIYAYIRHPIYLSFIILFFGLALILSYLSSFIIAGLALVFFYYKTIYEEKKLVKVYPEYQAYRQRTGRLLPRVTALFSLGKRE